MAEAVAKAKYLRTSVKKVNRILKEIRGKSTEEALKILNFLPNIGAKYIEKVLRSAIANAKDAKKMSEDKLFVKRAVADQGVILRRYRVAARGRINREEKPTSHITVAVAEKGEGK